jgi:hypothetical protein
VVKAVRRIIEVSQCEGDLESLNKKSVKKLKP